MSMLASRLTREDAPAPLEQLSERKVPESVRSVVSLLIFIHLFIVFVALAGYLAPSDLLLRMRRLFAPYTNTLFLDLSTRDDLHELTEGNIAGARLAPARLQQTYADTLDVDMELTVVVYDENGDEVETFTLPEPDSWGQNRRRQLALTATIGELWAIESLRTQLPVAIGQAVMDRHGADRAYVRCRRHTLQNMDVVDSADPSLADPYDERWYQTLFEGDLTRFQGQVGFLPRTAIGQAAISTEAATPRPNSSPDRTQ